MSEIRICGIENDSIVDGPGIRFTIFVQGCPHKCKGCHNPQSHDMNGGSTMTDIELLDKIKSNPLLDGVTFSGGEPFCQAKPLAQLAKKIHNMGLNVITYSGYRYEEIIKNNSFIPLLEQTDVLIDGRFEEDKKSVDLVFRGSSNQRIIDVRASLEKRKIIERSFD